MPAEVAHLDRDVVGLALVEVVVPGVDQAFRPEGQGAAGGGVGGHVDGQA